MKDMMSIRVSRGVAWRAAVVVLLIAMAVTPALASSESSRARCVVPRVMGKSLVVARRRLRAAHCGLGRVTGPRDATVGEQRPAPGRRERRGASVALTMVKKSTESSSAASGSPPSATPVGSTTKAGTTATGGDTTPGAGSTTGASTTTGGSPPTGGSSLTGTTTAPPSATTTTPTGTTTTPYKVAPEPLGILGDWKLVLDSEFDGSSLPAKWQTGWFGSGVTPPANSQEDACYSPSNVTFPGDGSMHMSVTEAASTCGGVNKDYTGAAVSTNPDDDRGAGFSYTYGVVEARVYIPAAAGGASLADWPAVWTDGQQWPYDGEDDIMEGNLGRACLNFHYYDAQTQNAAQAGPYCGGPSGMLLTPGWHTLASDWEPGSITYYYDGVKVKSVTTGVTSEPMYIVLDNSVLAGDTDVTPSSLQVQYVRVWTSASGS